MVRRKIAVDLWRDGFDPHRAMDGTILLTWDPAVGPIVAVLVLLAIVLACVVVYGVHMPPGPRGTSAVHRWFAGNTPLLGPRQGPEDDPDWKPTPPYWAG